MSQIWWENKRAGRQLTRQQTHTIFEQQKRKQIMENPHLSGGYDRAG